MINLGLPGNVQRLLAAVTGQMPGSWQRLGLTGSPVVIIYNDKV
jgi:hypothetical protein